VCARVSATIAATCHGATSGSSAIVLDGPRDVAAEHARRIDGRARRLGARRGGAGVRAAQRRHARARGGGDRGVGIRARGVADRGAVGELRGGEVAVERDRELGVGAGRLGALDEPGRDDLTRGPGAARVGEVRGDRVGGGLGDGVVAARDAHAGGGDRLRARVGRQRRQELGRGADRGGRDARILGGDERGERGPARLRGAAGAAGDRVRAEHVALVRGQRGAAAGRERIERGAAGLRERRGGRALRPAERERVGAARDRGGRDRLQRGAHRLAIGVAREQAQALEDRVRGGRAGLAAGEPRPLPHDEHGDRVAIAVAAAVAGERAHRLDLDARVGIGHAIDERAGRGRDDLAPRERRRRDRADLRVGVAEPRAQRRGGGLVGRRAGGDHLAAERVARGVAHARVGRRGRADQRRARGVVDRQPAPAVAAERERGGLRVGCRERRDDRRDRARVADSAERLDHHAGPGARHRRDQRAADLARVLVLDAAGRRGDPERLRRRGRVVGRAGREDRSQRGDRVGPADAPEPAHRPGAHRRIRVLRERDERRHAGRAPRLGVRDLRPLRRQPRPRRRRRARRVARDHRNGSRGEVSHTHARILRTPCLERPRLACHRRRHAH
jgi:hypothetical protein